MKETTLVTQLNTLCDRADKDIKNLSKFVYEFLYQALSNLTFETSEYLDKEEAWKEDTIADIDNILMIIKSDNETDIHYLVSLRTLLLGNSFVCVSKKITEKMQLFSN